jgi:glucokinase
MYLLFDIGGTKTRLAVSEDLTSFDEPLIFDTETMFAPGIILLSENIRKITGGKKIKGVVGGMAGVFDKDRMKLLKSPNLPDWENKLIGYELERICGVKPEIFNDADMAALGEAVFGGGKDGKIVAYMTVSTGVGGGLVIDKKIQQRTYGFEPGHLITDLDTKENLQDLIGGKNLERKYKIPAKEITDPEVYEFITDTLGVSLHNVIMLWSPDTIVVGGGISRDLDMDEIQEAIKSNMVIFPDVPEIKRAELGSLNGIWGALAQARIL